MTDNNRSVGLPHHRRPLKRSRQLVKLAAITSVILGCAFVVALIYTH